MIDSYPSRSEFIAKRHGYESALDELQHKITASGKEKVTD
jgi:hypothetical protein